MNPRRLSVNFLSVLLLLSVAAIVTGCGVKFYEPPETSSSSTETTSSSGSNSSSSSGAGATVSVSISEADTYSMGSALNGATISKVFVVTNNSSQALAALTATNSSAEFTFNGGTYPGIGGNCGSTLAVGANCNIDVLYTAIGGVSHNNTLTVSYTVATVAYTATRLMTGTSLNFAVLSSVATPANQLFVMSDNARTLTFTISNSGNYPASLNTITFPAQTNYLGGTYPGTGGTCSGVLNSTASLAIGASCTIVTTFLAPKQPGPLQTYAKFDLDYYDGAANQTLNAVATGYVLPSLTTPYYTPSVGGACASTIVLGSKIGYVSHAVSTFVGLGTQNFTDAIVSQNDLDGSRLRTGVFFNFATKDMDSNAISDLVYFDQSKLIDAAASLKWLPSDNNGAFKTVDAHTTNLYDARASMLMSFLTLFGNGYSSVSYFELGSFNLKFLDNTYADDTPFATSLTNPSLFVKSDVNGDGREDAIVSEFTSCKIYYLTQTAGAGFTETSMNLETDFTGLPVAGVDCGISSIVVEDFDLDGLKDIVVAGALMDQVLFIRQTSADNFAVIQSKPLGAGNFPIHVASVDTNLDGCKDIVVTSYKNPKVSVFRQTTVFAPPPNNCAGTFGAIATLSTPTQPPLFTVNSNFQCDGSTNQIAPISLSSTKDRYLAQDGFITGF